MMDTLLDKLMFWRSNAAGTDGPDVDSTGIDGCFTLPGVEDRSEEDGSPVDDCES